MFELILNKFSLRPVGGASQIRHDLCGSSGILGYVEHIKIRTAELKDAPLIATVHVKTWQYAYKEQVPDSYLDGLSIKRRTEVWEKTLKKPSKDVHNLIAEVNDRVIGWCTAGVNRDKDSSSETGELYGIYVLPEYIGQGIGSKLIEKAINILKNEGYARATLWVLVTNEKTKQWYESKGWRVEGGTKIEHRKGFDLNETRYVIDF